MTVEKPSEHKGFQWMLAGSLGLIIAGWLLGLLAGDWGLAAGVILLVAAFGLAAVSLKTAYRFQGWRKALPILLMTLSGLPVCCVAGGVAVGGAFSTVYDLARGKPGAFTPRPKVEWDASPGAVILQAARPIHSYHPSLSSDVTRNYIPEGRLFGDGRIVWAVYAGDGSRTVMEGRLTREQMTALLQECVDAGFFGWKDSYSAILPYDNPPSDYLTVNLVSAQKTVSVTMTEPPLRYTDFFQQVSSGAGAAGVPFQPAQATLIIEPTGQETQDEWDQGKLPIDLVKAADGITVEGETLEAAWRVVNKNPLGPPVVRIGGASYEIFLLAPELMYSQ